jgi:hypothetical protein
MAGCFALPSRLAGTNYAEADPPFIAETSPRIVPAPGLPAQRDLLHRVILIGDAGVPMESEPVLAALGRWGDVYPARTSVLFLGDNVYPAGIESGAEEEGEEVLRKQVEATTATRIFIPGNHDWGHAGTDRLLRQQAYLDASDAEFTPRDGCPGPVLRTLRAPRNGARGISAILFDIDPWYFGSEETLAGCENDTPEELAAAIARLVEENRDHWLFVGAHHPLETGGPHGGFSRGAIADFITGAILLITGTLQDTYEEGYREIMKPIEAALAASPPAFYVAGHDHNLQVLEGAGVAGYQVVSGAGATQRVRGGHVTSIEGTLFAHGHAGFVVVDFVKRGDREQALLHVIETEHDAPVFSMDAGVR